MAKKCAECGGVIAQSPRGRSAYCSANCRKAATRRRRSAWHEERRDAQLLYMREYRARDLDKWRAWDRAYYHRNADQILRREAERRRDNPGRHMRITPGQYWALRKSQGDACAICEKPFSELKNNPHIDHDHTCCPGRYGCGECVRGLLCPSCNRLMTIYDNGMWDRVFDYQRAYESRVCKEQEHG